MKFQNGQECGGAYIKLLMKDKTELDLVRKACARQQAF